MKSPLNSAAACRGPPEHQTRIHFCRDTILLCTTTVLLLYHYCTITTVLLLYYCTAVLLYCTVDGGNLAPPTLTHTHCFECTSKQQPRTPFFDSDDRSLRAVQDLCHWNDFVKARVHSNVKKGARGEAT